jgi:molybdopterin converting factor small subunit
MKAKLVFLGRLEELAGSGGADLALEGPLEWVALVEQLSSDYSSELVDLIAGDRVKVALNGALVADKQGIMLSDGDEIAFLPPVSGG